MPENSQFSDLDDSGCMVYKVFAIATIMGIAVIIATSLMATKTLGAELDCSRVHFRQDLRPRPTWSQKKILREMCKMSGGDRDFVMTIVVENPRLDPLLVTKNPDGSRNFGITQIHEPSHEKFVHSPQFKYWDKQIEYGLNLWEERKAHFSAYKVRQRALEFIEFG